MTTAGESRFLILETSGNVGHVAVADGDAILRQRTLDYPRRLARDLAPAARDLLREQKWRPNDITAVLVSRGPGSYTGLRVGIISAKTFAYATGCAILGIDTFAAIAAQANADVSVIADAQQEKVYAQQFTFPTGANLPHPASRLTILPLSAWLAQLPVGIAVTGRGLYLYRERLPRGISVADQKNWDPRPESLLRIGLLRWERGERDDHWTLEPLYLRPSSAEEKLISQVGQAPA